MCPEGAPSEGPEGPYICVPKEHLVIALRALIHVSEGAPGDGPQGRIAALDPREHAIEGIRQGVSRMFVGPDAAAAKCRAERGVVDGNDCLQAGGLVLDENDVFVIAHLRMIENGTVVN